MSNSVHSGSGELIQSVGIALDIIETVQARGKMGVTELANELEHSKSTIYNHLCTLEDRELLVHEADGYRLSLRVLDMANHVRDQIGNYDVIRSEIDTLADETGEIAQFGLEEHGKVSYLYKQAGERGVETASRVGTQQPMYSTGLGKAIMAYLPEERTEEIIRQTEFEVLTPQTNASPEDLREDLASTRERGYAIDDEENFSGLRCIAAPVTDNETVLGAVSITGPSSRFTMDRLHDELADEVQRAANVIELNTKFA
jgi:IclR family KDG regulon transcriptional repressor